MMKGWGALHRWVFPSSLLFSFFEVVAFLDPFGAAGGASTPYPDFTKVPKRLGGYYGDCGAWWDEWR
jgi:hypothetical protein